MKLFVMADMEGISGIHLPSQVKKEYPADYSYGKKLLTEEINFVVDALFRLGADEIVIRDGHGGGYNVNMGEVDGRAKYEPAVLPSLSWLDESFDGLIIIGQHSMAGTLNGFLDHTINSNEWFRYRINDLEAGEIAITAARAGARNVPVIAVTGDRMAVQEAKKLFGEENISCAEVKHGIGRNWADCMPIPQAHEVIFQALKEAVGRIGQIKPFKPSLQLNTRILTAKGIGNAGAYLGVSEPAVIIDCVKKAENRENAIVIRAYESTGSRRRTKLVLNIPCGICYETNMLEEIKQEIQVDNAGSGEQGGKVLEVEFGPFEVKTFLVKGRGN